MTPLLENLSALSDEMCRHRFRLCREDIIRLRKAFGLRETIVLDNGIVTKGDIAMVLVIRRMAYPCRWGDLRVEFGRSLDQLSRIFNHILGFLQHRFASLLDWDETRLTPQKLREHANIIHEHGAPLDCVFGFIDGTVHGIARPSVNQEAFYNGLKRKHSIKAHAAVAFDGVVFQFKLAVLLPNCKTCLDETDQIPSQFGTTPPSLGTYLALTMNNSFALDEVMESEHF